MNPHTIKLPQHEQSNIDCKKQLKTKKQLLRDDKHHSLVRRRIGKSPALRIRLPSEMLRLPWFEDIRLELECDDHVIWQTISSKVLDLPMAMGRAWFLKLLPEGNLASAVNMTPQVQKYDVS